MDPIKKHKKRIIKYFKYFYKKGYITARDGNAAVISLDQNNNPVYLVTKSSVRKHMMKDDSFTFVNREGKSLNELDRASIETMAHIAALDSGRHIVSVHTHPPNTVALAALFQDPNEADILVNKLNTEWPELFRYTKVGKIVPFLQPGSDRLHTQIKNALNDSSVDIIIMQRHGVLVRGLNMAECLEHIVRLEHICGIMLQILSANGGKKGLL